MQGCQIAEWGLRCSASQAPSLLLSVSFYSAPLPSLLLYAETPAEQEWREMGAAGRILGETTPSLPLPPMAMPGVFRGLSSVQEIFIGCAEGLALRHIIFKNRNMVTSEGNEHTLHFFPQISFQLAVCPVQEEMLKYNNEITLKGNTVCQK